MRLLVANRGEIARRVAHTARLLGIPTIAVYSEADAHAPHVRACTHAQPLLGAASSAPQETYLNIPRLLGAIERSNATHVHPGYGFLSESASFATALERSGVTFVGPPVAALEAMGDKSSSKRIMEAAQGVPLVPGYHGKDQNDDTLLAAATEMGFPVMIKPSMGGGGKGMKISQSRDDFLQQLTTARREAASAFNDDRVLLERYVPRSRHVEVQVMCDTHGNAVHLYERDCSVQRRHQKLLEESPAPGLTEAQRRRYGEAAVAAAKAVGYVGAGTVEFIADADDPGDTFYFCEMNTRLQVEHPVTECALGVDLVEWQLRVARGEVLGFGQEEVDCAARNSMHAIEARLYAENPSNNFLPSTGPIWYVRWPKAREGRALTRFETMKDSPFNPVRTPYVRVDVGYEAGGEVSANYDPMLGKLIASAPTRDEAVRLLHDALAETRFMGLSTNVDFLKACAIHPDFVKGGVDTAWMEGRLDAIMDSAQDRWWQRVAASSPDEADRIAAVAALIAARRWDVSAEHAASGASLGAWMGADGFRISEATPMPDEVVEIVAGEGVEDGCTKIRARVRRRRASGESSGKAGALDLEVVVEVHDGSDGDSAVAYRAVPGAAGNAQGADDPRAGDGVSSYPTRTGSVRLISLENRRVQVASPHGETVEKMSSRAYVDGKPLDAELVVANRGIANAWVGEGTATMDLRILSEEEASAEDATADLEASSGKSAAGVGGLGASADPSKVASPLFGQVARISASCIRGQAVKRGEPLVWVTSMKLEHELAARRDGVVADVLVEVGEQVKEGQVVVTLDRWEKVTDSD